MLHRLGDAPVAFEDLGLIVAVSQRFLEHSRKLPGEQLPRCPVCNDLIRPIVRHFEQAARPPIVGSFFEHLGAGSYKSPRQLRFEAEEARGEKGPAIESEGCGRVKRQGGPVCDAFGGDKVGRANRLGARADGLRLHGWRDFGAAELQIALPRS